MLVSTTFTLLQNYIMVLLKYYLLYYRIILWYYSNIIYYTTELYYGTTQILPPWMYISVTHKLTRESPIHESPRFKQNRRPGFQIRHS